MEVCRRTLQKGFAPVQPSCNQRSTPPPNVSIGATPLFIYLLHLHLSKAWNNAAKQRNKLIQNISHITVNLPTQDNLSQQPCSSDNKRFGLVVKYLIPKLSQCALTLPLN